MLKAHNAFVYVKDLKMFFHEEVLKFRGPASGQVVIVFSLFEIIFTSDNIPVSLFPHVEFTFGVIEFA
jgi:hypothetical protein